MESGSSILSYHTVSAIVRASSNLNNLSLQHQRCIKNLFDRESIQNRFYEILEM